VALAAMAALAAGCSAFATPRPPVVSGGSLAPAGPVGYVVCPSSVSPVELDTDTAEAAIPLPVTGEPALGDFAIATSPDGRWAYVVTTEGYVTRAAPGATTTPSVHPAPGSSSTAAPGSSTTAATGGTGVRNVVIPIDLVTQVAGSPIVIPGQGGTHAIVVLGDGRTVLAASGSSVVPVDTGTGTVGPPVQLGPGRTVVGMVLDPARHTLYTLVPGAVVPVDTASGAVEAAIPTGLSVSSVYSPHGIALSPDGTTLYVVGQGGTDFGGRLLPIATATGATQPATSFDRFGIADPAAVAVTADGSSQLVADAVNNWVLTVDGSDPTRLDQPARLPPRSEDAATAGTQHPTDLVLGPGTTGAFLVDGFDAVIPYAPSAGTFGRPIAVCSGASSMAVAPAPTASAASADR
jgi:hypothetical protein